MRLAVLTSPQSWYWHDLVRAADQCYHLECAAFSNISAELNGGHHCCASNDNELNAVDAVLVRTMPPGSLEQVVFRMNALAQVEQSGVIVVNPVRSLETAIDKYLTLAKLQVAGLTVPQTFVCQTAEQAMQAYHRLGGDVVVKPLFGGEGRGIMRVEDEALALRAFKSLVQLNAVLYMQRFIDHPGFDLRVMVIGDQFLGMRRCNHLDWRTNVTRGARAEPLDLDDDLMEIARNAAHAVGASVAGVDILSDQNGQRYVLEVNAVPGWKALARVLDVDVASLILRHIQQLVDVGGCC